MRAHGGDPTLRNYHPGRRVRFCSGMGGGPVVTPRGPPPVPPTHLARGHVDRDGNLPIRNRHSDPDEGLPVMTSSDALPRLSLSTLDTVGTAAQGPSVDPRSIRVGVVHLGVGAFHRAHQAVFTGSSDLSVGEVGLGRVRGGRCRRGQDGPVGRV